MSVDPTQGSFLQHGPRATRASVSLHTCARVCLKNHVGSCAAHFLGSSSPQGPPKKQKNTPKHKNKHTPKRVLCSCCWWWCWIDPLSCESRSLSRICWDTSKGICAPTNSGTFHKPKYEKSVDFSGTANRSGSSQHVSIRDVKCKVSKVF